MHINLKNSMTKYWTTAQGEKIRYKDLEDSHLKNIIKDGYRSRMIKKEADRRGFDVPIRKVDELKLYELMMWVESFNSTALSGNQEAEKMARLWEEDKARFLFLLNRLLENEK